MATLNNPFVVYGYKGAEYLSKTPNGYLVSDRFFAKWICIQYA